MIYLKKLALLSVLVVSIFLFVFVLPASAQNSYEGPKGLDDRGPLTKVTFIHYKKGYGKPSGITKGKPSTSCYTYIANGAKWKTVENYAVNPSGSQLPKSEVLSALNSGVTEWERYGGNIFGNGAADYTANYENGYNEKNEVSFGPDSEGIIAETTVWGYFYGPPKTRELVEWDMKLNTYYTWGDVVYTNNTSLMDLQNIATHELGHSAGMGDLYNTVCNQETMYGYSYNGETIKRDLNKGDIAGIQALY